MSAIEEVALLPLSSYPYPEAADRWEKLQDFKEQKTYWPTSTPKYSDKSFDYENQLVCYTGPLRSPKKAPAMPVTMSGPIYYGDGAANFLKPSQTDSKEKKMVVDQHEHLLRSGPLGVCNDPCTENKMVVDQHEHLLRSGPLGVCNDPYCSICPTHFYNNSKAMQEKHGKDQNQAKTDLKFQKNLHGEAECWSRRFFSNLHQHIPGVINPHTKFMQRWNRFFVISCLLAIFVDPLFFFLLTVRKENKCLDFDWRLAKVVVVFRSATDFIYLLHMLLQFKLAYILPESQVVGAGVLVDHPKKIARNYLRKGFWVDLAVVLPLPQIMILLKQPNLLGFAGANETKNVLRAVVLIQYLPRFYRFLPLLAGQSANGFIFESAWANFVINLFAFVLAGHLVGSSWYLFGLQRVNQCLRDACHKSKLSPCKHLIDCGNNRNPDYWRNNSRAISCFGKDGFPYGIYLQAVNLTTERSVAKRYTYSLFWGFQQISTLAGNQIPSYFIWEVLFTMAIVGLGLLLFALLIGNMHNFLQALGRRRLEMMLRRRDVDLWMNHRRLPVELRRKVRAAERYNWTASRGVDEEMLMANLPEDLQTSIRRHLFKFLKKVRIFSVMDEPVLDSISEKLRHRTYIRGGHILVPGDPIKRITFIVRGILESVGEDGIGVVQLSEGDVCGEELLSWCLEHSSVSKDTKKWRTARQRPISNRTVTCLTNVEAFTLAATDMKEVTNLFATLLPKIHVGIRSELPSWRVLAARRIQIAWRKKMKGRLIRSDANANVSGAKDFASGRRK